MGDELKGEWVHWPDVGVRRWVLDHRPGGVHLGHLPRDQIVCVGQHDSECGNGSEGRTGLTAAIVISDGGEEGGRAICFRT